MPERAYDQLVRGSIGLCDRLCVFVSIYFALDPQRLIVIFENGRASLARQPQCNSKLMTIHLAFRFHPSAFIPHPSSLALVLPARLLSRSSAS